jgi:toxin ParE1/3/4
MAFRVVLAAAAERDIEDIYRFIALHDSQTNADQVLDGLDRTCQALAMFPERGNIPKELQPLGIDDYREAHWKPYRIVYRIAGRRVIVYCVFDGRRDVQSFLQRRLLR